METLVPLISSGTAGPLGVLHLPRLWLKASLEARGKLDPRYPGCGKGFDQMTLDALGLDREATLEFIRTARPTYPQFEAWIKAQPGVKLDATAIERHNATLRNYLKPDEKRCEILRNNALPEDPAMPKDAIGLNDLDSWQEFHDAVLK